MKEMGLQLSCFAGFFHPPEENLPIDLEKVIPMNMFINPYKNML